jgi:hypothetical protein
VIAFGTRAEVKVEADLELVEKGSGPGRVNDSKSHKRRLHPLGVPDLVGLSHQGVELVRAEVCHDDGTMSGSMDSVMDSALLTT